MAHMICTVTADDVIKLLLKKDAHEYIGCLVSTKKTLDGPETQVLVLNEPLKPMND